MFLSHHHYFPSVENACVLKDFFLFHDSGEGLTRVLDYYKGKVLKILLVASIVVENCRGKREQSFSEYGR